MRNKTVVISGVTGMLGSMVYKVLKDKYTLILLYKNKKKLELLNVKYGGISNHTCVQFNIDGLLGNINNNDVNDKFSSIKQKLLSLGKIDAFVNCAGIITPDANIDFNRSLLVNSIFPKILSSIYREKLIHITTDCIFDGNEGRYDEASFPSPTDYYGITKLLGEVSDLSLVLRTSIIGPELSGSRSLFEWICSRDTPAKGYTNHYWNGLTTKELSKTFIKIIDNPNKYPKQGLFHIYSTDISKHDLLVLIKNKMNLAVEIRRKKVNKVDRTLRSVYPFCGDLNIPSIYDMINDL